MRKNIFGIRRADGGILLDSFFTELVLIIPVFAISCCAVLQMFSIAAKTAENRQIKASALPVPSRGASCTVREDRSNSVRRSFSAYRGLPLSQTAALHTTLRGI